MPYNFVADGFHTKKLCSRLSSSKVRFYTEYGRFAFSSGIEGQRTMFILGSLESAYSGLPISVDWTFCCVLPLRRYERIDWKSAISLQRGQLDPNFQVEGVAPTNHSSSQKTRLNDLSYGIKIWTDFSSVLSQSTRLWDGQTDRQLSRG